MQRNRNKCSFNIFRNERSVLSSNRFILLYRGTRSAPNSPFSECEDKALVGINVDNKRNE